MPTTRKAIELVNVDPWEMSTLPDCRKLASDIIRRQGVRSFTVQHFQLAMFFSCYELY